MSYGRQMGYGPPLGAVIPKSTYDAVLAPTVNEDSGDGYSVGSRLIDIVLEHEHVLVNPAAGAAVWKPTTYTTSAGLPDPYVPPDGDWDVTGSISATVDVSAASFTGGTATLAIAAAGDALAIALATDLTNQAIVTTEDDVIRTSPMWEATRQASATGSIATLTKLAIGTTTAAANTGVLLQNTTDAAAAGNQQYSPLFLLGAEGWRTNATAETQTVQMGWQVQPVEGAASPTGNLVVVSSIDGGAFTTPFTFSSAGNLTCVGLYPSSTCIFTGQVTFNSTTIIANNKVLRIGSAETLFLFESTNNAVDTTVMGLGDTSRTLLVCDEADYLTNWGLSQQTDPTIRLQSSDATDVTEQLSLAWNYVGGKRGWKLDLGGDGVGSEAEYLTSNGDGQISVFAHSVEVVYLSSTNMTIAPAAGSGLLLTQRAHAAAVPAEILTVTGAAHTTMTASTEATSMLFDFGQTMQWATGALASNATIKINPPTLAFVGASTVSKAYTVSISGPPVAGANCTLAAANTYALYSGGHIGLVGGGRVDFRTDGGEYITSPGDGQLDISVAGAPNIHFLSTVVRLPKANGYLSMGSSDQCGFHWNTTADPDDWVMFLPALSRSLTVCDKADVAVDFGHTIQTNPTIYIQSSNATDVTEYLSLSYGTITTGNGELGLAPAAGYGVTLTQTAAETTTPAELLTLTGATIGGVTPITASTEYTDAVFNFAHTVTFATGALGSQRACRIEGPTYAFAGASTITNCATLYLTAPIAGANCTITNRWALWTESGNIRSDGNIYTVEAAAADPYIAAYGQWWVLNSAPCMPMFDDDTGTERSIITGLGTSGAAIRAGTITVTGTGDNTTCTAEMFDDWNSEALAVETIDSDFPTGGTRFDLSADKLTITAKGITKGALISLSHHIHSSDVGVDWNVHVGIAGGKLTITANVATTGVAVDFAAAALNGKIIDFNFTYLTSD